MFLIIAKLTIFLLNFSHLSVITAVITKRMYSDNFIKHMHSKAEELIKLERKYSSNDKTAREIEHSTNLISI